VIEIVREGAMFEDIQNERVTEVAERTVVRIRSPERPRVGRSAAAASSTGRLPFPRQNGQERRIRCIGKIRGVESDPKALRRGRRDDSLPIRRRGLDRDDHPRRGMRLGFDGCEQLPCGLDRDPEVGGKLPDLVVVHHRFASRRFAHRCTSARRHTGVAASRATGSGKSSRRVHLTACCRDVDRASATSARPIRSAASTRGMVYDVHSTAESAPAAHARSGAGHGGTSSMPTSPIAPSAFTRAELEAIAEGLAVLIAESPDHDPAQRAMRKVRDEIRRLNTAHEEEK
jgi:hypothetical protein